MDIEQRDIVARRNAPFAEVWTFEGEDGPVDLTGATVAMQVRLYGAQPGDSLIDLGEVGAELTEGLTTDDGTIGVFISESSLKFLPAGKPGADTVFIYDLVVALPDRVAEVWQAGRFVVKPGVTDRLVFLIDGVGDYLVDGAGDYLLEG